VEGSRTPVRESIEFARIVAFTDGVFAIAITLLVLSLEAPSDLQASALHAFLIDSWPQLFAYFLSFAVIGRFWIGHHHVFSMLQDFDRRLIVLNLAYLSMIVLVPFPTELLASTGWLRRRGAVCAGSGDRGAPRLGDAPLRAAPRSCPARGPR
jgi:uncharacterized membrane protein